ncbi:MAG: helix-turn-helix domain-containing protein [Actinomycetota bacterium]|nr:helix-turn-helix domain-containing protein [Actinomycetota bacterium]
MTVQEDIGVALVAARIARGLTQRELAAQLGIHQQQIARWERERYGCVSLSRLTRVATALGLGVAAVLLGGEAKGATESPLAAEEQAGYGAAVLETSGADRSAPVRDLGEVIVRIRAHAAELQERYGVTGVDVFGSFARGEQRSDSDVDLIVEVAVPTLDTVFGSEEYLTELLGRKADAGSFASLRPHVRSYVDGERVHVLGA